MSQVNYVDFEENEIDEIYMIEDVLRELQDDQELPEGEPTAPRSQMRMC